MKLPHDDQWQRRPAFTLIELLVVILIIAILAGLITIASFRGLKSANRVKVRNDITQLGESIENFKAKFGVYPPSRIKLSETGASPPVGGQGYDLSLNPATGQPNNPLDYASVQFLRRLWPRINWSSTNTPPSPGTPWTGIDWNGDGLQSPDVILEGEQCLVFFLGGIPTPLTTQSPVPTCTGFSTNPQNPAFQVLSGGDTIQPFYEFDTSRLTTLQGLNITPTAYVYSAGGAAPPVSPFHYVYLDTYLAKPYAYFGTGGNRNGYNPYASQLLVPMTGCTTPLQTSDCMSLGVWPYAGTQLASGAVQYLNPNTFQIISAGEDGVFGRGTDLNPNPFPCTGTVPTPFWTLALAGNTTATSVSWDYTTPTPNGTAGLDDLASFYDSTLGSGSQ